MITGIFTLIGVLIGFYLAKYSVINQKISEKVEEVQEKIKEKRYPSKVIRTDEVALEKERQRAEHKERITLEEILEKEK